MKQSLEEYLSNPLRLQKSEILLRKVKEKLISLIDSGFRPWYVVTKDQCSQISKKIKEFNINVEKKNKLIEQGILKEEKKSRMLEWTWDELYNHANENGCVIIRKWDELCWFISATKLTTTLDSWKDVPLFERGSLIVFEEFENQGLWSTLIAEMLFNRQKLPMYSVTDKPKVVAINKKYWLTEYKAHELPSNIFKTINDVWELWENDVVFGNQVFDFIIESQK